MSKFVRLQILYDIVDSNELKIRISEKNIVHVVTDGFSYLCYLCDENDDRETGWPIKIDDCVAEVVRKREGKKRVITLFLVSNVDRHAAAFGSFSFFYPSAEAAFRVYASLYPASTPHIGNRVFNSIFRSVEDLWGGEGSDVAIAPPLPTAWAL